ncbi:MAG TPA: extracellular solute-binding protein [Thermomicrobiales bacterium]|nr:extracellular solute-binding protein [Thermomicrobiales bacterium]
MNRRSFLINSMMVSAGLALPGSRSVFAQGTPVVNEDVSGTVVYWSTYNTVSPEYQVLTEQVIPGFNARYPNVEIKAQAIPDADMRQKLLTAAAGGETPDVARMDIVQVPEFAEMGALAAIDDLIPDFASYAERFFQGPLATNTFQGKHYGIPLDTNTRVIFYNPAVLEEAGVSEPPTTFDAFNDAAVKIAEAGKFAYSEGGTGAWNMLPWIWSNGGGITNEDYTQATGVLNGEGTVGAVEMIKGWLDNNQMSEAVFGGGLSTSQELAEGSVAMIVDGPWMPSIFKAQYPDFEFGLSQFPAGPGGSISVVGGENTVLFDASQNKEAALAFAMYLADPEAQLAMATTGQMPVLSELKDSEDVPDYFPTFLTQLDTAQPRTPSPAWPKIDEAVTAAIYQAITGELDAQAALDEAAAAVDALLAKYQS